MTSLSLDDNNIKLERKLQNTTNLLEGNLQNNHQLQGNLQNHSQERKLLNHSQERKLLNHSQERKLLNHSQERKLLNHSQERKLLNNSQERKLLNNSQERKLLNKSQERKLLNNTSQTPQTQDGSEPEGGEESGEEAAAQVFDDLSQAFGDHHPPHTPKQKKKSTSQKEHQTIKDKKKKKKKKPLAMEVQTEEVQVKVVASQLQTGWTVEHKMRLPEGDWCRVDCVVEEVEVEEEGGIGVKLRAVHSGAISDLLVLPYQDFTRLVRHALPVIPAQLDQPSTVQPYVRPGPPPKPQRHQAPRKSKAEREAEAAKAKVRSTKRSRAKKARKARQELHEAPAAQASKPKAAKKPCPKAPSPPAHVTAKLLAAAPCKTPVPNTASQREELSMGGSRRSAPSVEKLTPERAELEARLEMASRLSRSYREEVQRRERLTREPRGLITRLVRRLFLDRTKGWWVEPGTVELLVESPSRTRAVRVPWWWRVDSLARLLLPGISEADLGQWALLGEKRELGHEERLLHCPLPRLPLALRLRLRPRGGANDSGDPAKTSSANDEAGDDEPIPAKFQEPDLDREFCLVLENAPVGLEKDELEGCLRAALGDAEFALAEGSFCAVESLSGHFAIAHVLFPTHHQASAARDSLRIHPQVVRGRRLDVSLAADLNVVDVLGGADRQVLSWYRLRERARDVGAYLTSPQALLVSSPSDRLEISSAFLQDKDDNVKPFEPRLTKKKDTRKSPQAKCQSTLNALLKEADQKIRGLEGKKIGVKKPRLETAAVTEAKSSAQDHAGGPEDKEEEDKDEEEEEIEAGRLPTLVPAPVESWQLVLGGSGSVNKTLLSSCLQKLVPVLSQCVGGVKSPDIRAVLEGAVAQVKEAEKALRDAGKPPIPPGRTRRPPMTAAQRKGRTTLRGGEEDAQLLQGFLGAMRLQTAVFASVSEARAAEALTGHRNVKAAVARCLVSIKERLASPASPADIPEPEKDDASQSSRRGPQVSNAQRLSPTEEPKEPQQPKEPKDKPKESEEMPPLVDLSGSSPPRPAASLAPPSSLSAPDAQPSPDKRLAVIINTLLENMGSWAAIDKTGSCMLSSTAQLLFNWPEFKAQVEEVGRQAELYEEVRVGSDMDMDIQVQLEALRHQHRNAAALRKLHWAYEKARGGNLPKSARDNFLKAFLCGGRPLSEPADGHQGDVMEFLGAVLSSMGMQLRGSLMEKRAATSVVCLCGATEQPSPDRLSVLAGSPLCESGFLADATNAPNILELIRQRCHSIASDCSALCLSCDKPGRMAFADSPGVTGLPGGSLLLGIQWPTAQGTFVAKRLGVPLDFSPVEAGLELEDPAARLSIQAAVLHSGATPTSGHFVCVVRAELGFLLLDDNSVTGNFVRPISAQRFQELLEGTAGWRAVLCRYALSQEPAGAWAGLCAAPFPVEATETEMAELPLGQAESLLGIQSSLRLTEAAAEAEGLLLPTAARLRSSPSRVLLSFPASLPLSRQSSAREVLRVLKGLQSLHAAGLLHCAVRPSALRDGGLGELLSVRALPKDSKRVFVPQPAAYPFASPETHYSEGESAGAWVRAESDVYSVAASIVAVHLDEGERGLLAPPSDAERDSLLAERLHQCRQHFQAKREEKLQRHRRAITNLANYSLAKALREEDLKLEEERTWEETKARIEANLRRKVDGELAGEFQLNLEGSLAPRRLPSLLAAALRRCLSPKPEDRPPLETLIGLIELLDQPSAALGQDPPRSDSEDEDQDAAMESGAEPEAEEEPQEKEQPTSVAVPAAEAMEESGEAAGEPSASAARPTPSPDTFHTLSSHSPSASQQTFYTLTPHSASPASHPASEAPRALGPVTPMELEEEPEAQPSASSLAKPASLMDVAEAVPSPASQPARRKSSKSRFSYESEQPMEEQGEEVPEDAAAEEEGRLFMEILFLHAWPLVRAGAAELTRRQEEGEEFSLEPELEPEVHEGVPGALAVAPLLVQLSSSPTDKELEDLEAATQLMAYPQGWWMEALARLAELALGASREGVIMSSAFEPCLVCQDARVSEELGVMPILNISLERSDLPSDVASCYLVEGEEFTECQDEACKGAVVRSYQHLSGVAGECFMLKMCQGRAFDLAEPYAVPSQMLLGPGLGAVEAPPGVFGARLELVALLLQPDDEDSSPDEAPLPRVLVVRTQPTLADVYESQRYLRDLDEVELEDFLLDPSALILSKARLGLGQLRRPVQGREHGDGRPLRPSLALFRRLPGPPLSALGCQGRLEDICSMPERSRIGGGAFGAVFRATRKADGMELAIKCQGLRKYDGPISLRELEILIGLQSGEPEEGMREVVGVLLLATYFLPDPESADHDLRFNLAMGLPLAERGDLLAFLSSLTNERLKADDFYELGRDFLSGLAFLHRRDILHRDLKPANLLLFDGVTPARKSTLQLRLTDFGLSERLRNGWLVTQGRAGSLSYGYPEGWEADLVILTPGYDTAAAAQILAEAVGVYETLTGERPDLRRQDPDAAHRQHMDDRPARLAAYQAQPGTGLERVPFLTDAYKACIKRAQHPEPDFRPTLEELREEHEASSVAFQKGLLKPASVLEEEPELTARSAPSELHSTSPRQHAVVASSAPVQPAPRHSGTLSACLASESPARDSFARDNLAPDSLNLAPDSRAPDFRTLVNLAPDSLSGPGSASETLASAVSASSPPLSEGPNETAESTASLVADYASDSS